MGTLKAKVNGLWTPIVGAAQAAADLARWNSAWGNVAISGSSNQTVTATAAILLSGTSTVVTLVAGRRYSIRLITTNSYAQTQGETWAVQPFLDGVALSTAFYSVDIGNNYLSPGVALEVLFNTTSGAHTLDLRAYRVNATGGSMQARFQFYLDDVGPVTQAAASPPAASPRVVASGNALGIIAMGAMKFFSNTAIAASTETAITEPLSLYTHVGRRYRLQCRFRALTGSGYIYLRASGLGIAANDYYRQVTGNFESLDISLIFDGQNAVGTYQVVANPSAGMNIYTEQAVSNFYIEDMGPSTAPAMPFDAAAPVPWNGCALASGWTNNSGQPAMYRVQGDMLQLQGSIANTNAPAGAITTLGVEARPLRAQVMNTPYMYGTPATTYSITSITLQTDGRITYDGAKTNVAFLILTGITFLT